MIKEYIQNAIDTNKKILEDSTIPDKIQIICNEIVKTLKSGGKILFVGNGGSASDCDHLATEFVSKFYKDRHAFNAISLTSNNSLITALSNDFGYQRAFSRQIEAIGQKDDVLIALSTSGNSKNILEALDVANEMGLKTVGFTGSIRNPMDSKCNMLIKIPSDETPTIQEATIMLGHLICKIAEEELFN